MCSRLLIGILGNRNSGKSNTWNQLFNNTVRTGKYPRSLELLPGKFVEVFLVSGSFEERGEYAGNVLGSQNCRIILCSLQYTNEVHKTLNYFAGQDFHLYVQWLNPGYHDADLIHDDLNIAENILQRTSTFAIRNGTVDSSSRIREIREFIYGWASSRDLVFSTAEDE